MECIKKILYRLLTLTIVLLSIVTNQIQSAEEDSRSRVRAAARGFSRFLRENARTMGRGVRSGLDVISNIIVGEEPIEDLTDMPTVTTTISLNQPNSFNFINLPGYIQEKIIELLTINKQATTLDEAAFAIRSLALVNRSLSNHINNQPVLDSIVYYLMERFNSPLSEVLEALHKREFLGYYKDIFGLN